MKTTLNLPDELVREIKIRAAKENRKLQDLVAELLRCGLAQTSPRKARRRLEFPLITGGNPPSPGQETPEHLAQVLLDEEADAFIR
ncbi:antitoxin [bacterium CPR1]|nr:antitoxin [bacterium CPR1]